QRHSRLGLAVGTLQLGSYGIAIWAMTVAPIAIVAALRETSVLFGALIAIIILKEPHAGQARGSGAPHSEQNFAASGTLALQLGHFIDASRTTARRIQAATVTRLSQATSGPNFTAQLRGSSGLRA